MKTPEEFIPCPRCNGMGQLINPAHMGKQMRAKREAKKLSLSTIATKMKVSKGYLSDLELGRRGWNDGLIQTYERALKK